MRWGRWYQKDHERIKEHLISLRDLSHTEEWTKFLGFWTQEIRFATTDQRGSAKIKLTTNPKI
jgi:hypothetical protein